MKNLLFILFVLGLSITLTAQTKTPPLTGNGKPVEKTQAGNYSYNIIPGINKTWGYDVLMERRLLIHQPSVPGLPGNEGFKTKASAEKVAKLVIEKIKKGEMPPTVTIEEMKKLKVLQDEKQVLRKKENNSMQSLFAKIQNDVIFVTKKMVLKHFPRCRYPWQKAFQRMHSNGDDNLLIDDVFNDEEFDV